MDEVTSSYEVQEGLRKIYNFDHEDFEFTDIFEYNFKEPTYNFIWCCAAIAHGVLQYDMAMEQKKEIQASKGPSM